MSILLGVPLAAVLGDYRRLAHSLSGARGWRCFWPPCCSWCLCLTAGRRPNRASPGRTDDAGRCISGHLVHGRHECSGPRRLGGGSSLSCRPILILTYGLRTAEVGLPMAGDSLLDDRGAVAGRDRIGRMRMRLGVTAGLLLLAAIRAGAWRIFLLGWSAPGSSVSGSRALHVAGRPRHHRSRRF